MKFQGAYNNSIDPKGRASIPARFREELSRVCGDERLMVTQNKGGLVAYPMPEWEKIMGNVEALDPGQRRDDIYLSLISPATECSFDKVGRIQLSQSHRDYAGLESEIREIVVVGMAGKIMIWSKSKHAEIRAQAESRLDADPQTLADIGF
ncbi:MAG TPA: division/cell wall cluster transcriptional repressor MraZ [Deferrimonas sp.]|jgi:MraZ protein